MLANSIEGFPDDTLIHHQIAAEMLGLCLQKSQRAELTPLCEELRSAQQAQTRILQAWLTDWYGAKPNQQSRVGEHMSQEYRAFLATARSATGAEFEEAFLRGMGCTTGRDWQNQNLGNNGRPIWS